MSMHAEKPVVAGPQAVDIDASGTGGQEMSEKTAGRLRDICTRTDEDFDTSLSETQALRRIAALTEAHDLD